MTNVPEKCNPYFKMIQEGLGREIPDLEGLIDCLSKQISDNEGQKRAGKKSQRKAVEIVGKLKSGELEKFNPNLAFHGKGDPLDLSDAEFDKLQGDMLQLNWEIMEPEEKEFMKLENDHPEMSDDEFFEWVKKEELGEDEPDGDS